jgi:hypothetical protein
VFEHFEVCMKVLSVVEVADWMIGLFHNTSQSRRCDSV